MDRTADFCDVDSDKWRQYAQRKRLPVKWIYSREARVLLCYERDIAARFDRILFVSEAEAGLFRSLAPEVAAKVSFFDNGVDTGFFDPGRTIASPFGENRGPVTVFTGAMDYWANVDAVTWFSSSIWPLVRARAPAAEFWIVGSNPTQEVKSLERIQGITVTGRVPDVRPYMAHADVIVAPMRIARGTQNKILEALAMARPVACTPAAAEGLRLTPHPGFRVNAEAAGFAGAVLDLFDFGSNPQGRNEVVARYAWSANLAILDELIARPDHLPVPALASL